MHAFEHGEYLKEDAAKSDGRILDSTCGYGYKVNNTQFFEPLL